MERPDSDSVKSGSRLDEKDVGDVYGRENIHSAGLPPDPDEGLSDEEKAAMVSRACS